MTFPALDLTEPENKCNECAFCEICDCPKIKNPVHVEYIRTTSKEGKTELAINKLNEQIEALKEDGERLAKGLACSAVWLDVENLTQQTLDRANRKLIKDHENLMKKIGGEK